MQGHAGTIQIHDVNLIDRSRRRCRPRKVPRPKKRPAKGEEPNDLVANAVKAFLKPNKQKRAKDSSDSGSEDEQEHYNFEIVKIGGE